MKSNVVVGNVVFDLNARAAGVVVVKLPRGNRAVRLDSALDIDHAGRSKISPGEFFFARPDELHWFVRCFCEPRGFNRALAGMFAAVTRAGVGNNDANFVFGNMKRLRQFGAHAKRSLRTGPNGQLATVPFGHGGARLERRMRDVRDGVGLFELFISQGKAIGHRTLRTSAASAALFSSWFAQNIKQFGV